MEISREVLISDLEQVKEGLSSREYIEQSSCFAFKDGMVMTFNDEIACRKPTQLGITGAVQAGPLLSILQKISDDTLQVIEKEGEVEFRGRGKRFGVVKESNIFLPIDRVETPGESDWRDLPREFIEGITQVIHCVGRDESHFILTCVHITPEYVEACDNLQLMRYSCKSKIEEEFLVRGDSISPITNLGMTAIALTNDWVHFRNEEGLIYSIRKYKEKYPSLDSVIEMGGSWITFPPGLKEVCERAAIVAREKADDVTIRIRVKDKIIQVIGEGVSGWYKEIKKVGYYDGQPIEFLIHPYLMMYIAENYTQARITNDRMKIEGDGWVYVTVLGKDKGEEEEEEEE